MKKSPPQSHIAIGRNKSKDVGERRKTQKLPGKGQTIQTKQDL